MAQDVFLDYSLGDLGSGVNEVTSNGTFVSDFVPLTLGGPNILGNLKFGPDGNLYVTANDSVRKYNGTTGASLGDFVTGLNGATDIVWDKSGNAFVVENMANRVSEFSSNGTLLKQFTNGLSNPVAAVMTPSDSLLVSNFVGGNISQIITSTGETSAFSTGLVRPTGITLGPDGRYYVSTYNQILGEPTTIQVINSNGGASTTWSSGGPLYLPSYSVFAGNRLIVVDRGGGFIKTFDATNGSYVGTFSAGFGGYGIAVRPGAVPEPTPLLAFAAGACLLVRRRKRR